MLQSGSRSISKHVYETYCSHNPQNAPNRADVYSIGCTEFHFVPYSVSHFYYGLKSNRPAYELASLNKVRGL